MVHRSIAVLAVADLLATVRFYEEVLGFRKSWLWGDPPTFGCASLGRAEIFFCQQPDLAQRVEGHMHCFFGDEEIDALHERHLAAGAPIVSPIENKSWGVREYTVRDPNGYHLRFGGYPTYERPDHATDALPPHIVIEAGLPDPDTYRGLFTSVSWVPHQQIEAVLENTLVGVLAIDSRDGQAVGMARATGDGRQYMIWDVIVRPTHQGQKIGRAMIEALLKELRDLGAPPGSFVGLFTPKPGFYEKIGFRKEIAMCLTL